MNHVAKIIEIVGTSDTSIDDAIRGAIDRAAQTIDKLRWFEVTQVRGHIEDQKVDRFQVMMKVGFALHEDEGGGKEGGEG